MISNLIKFFLIIFTVSTFLNNHALISSDISKLTLFTDLFLLQNDEEFIDKVKKFLEEGGDINVRNNARNMPLLMFAAGSGLENATKFLIEKGVDLNAQDLYGYTALMEAAKYGQDKIAKLLLEKGADINIKDNKGKTAHSLAIENGNNSTADLIKAYYSYIN